MNQLILGDCLEVMRKMERESIDLIYLDPPFFSNRNYEVIWGDKGEIRSFEDRWSGGIGPLHRLAQRTRRRNTQTFKTNRFCLSSLRLARRCLYQSSYIRQSIW